MKKHSCSTIWLFSVGLILAAFAAIPANGQIAQGTWYCIEAEYKDTLATGFNATFTILPDDYYEAAFEFGEDDGNVKALYSVSENVFKSRLLTDINLQGGGSYTSGGQLIYDYMIHCSGDTWRKYAQVAFGWGAPDGATENRILFSVDGDSVLVLKNLDEEIVLTYTYGALKPAHNPVVFAVNMRVQQQLGFFNPALGGRVVVRGDFNDWAAEGLAMEETDIPGIYRATLDLPGKYVGTEFAYKFVILQSNEAVVESDPNRTFTLEGYGNDLGAPYFDRRLRPDEVNAIVVTGRELKEYSPAVAYNPRRDEFLVVWSEEFEDIFGQLVKGDGTLSGSRFPVTNGPQEEYYPQVEYNTRRDEWLVIWNDYRNGKADVYGVRLTPAGKKLVSPHSAADSSFAICNHDSTQYTPRLAYNYFDDCYLVVWMDFRNTVRHNGQIVNYDIYGQRVGGGGALLPPGNPDDPSQNFAITKTTAYDEYYCDVAYCGEAGKTLNEWLVVFSRIEWSYSMAGGRIWGVRVKGNNGLRLNTWGVEQPSILGKSAGGTWVPPWLPEFPIGWDGKSLWAMTSFFQGSPHVESNDDDLVIWIDKPAAKRYPIPEFLVAWTDFRNGADIYCQRVAYFPDSTAYRLGLKTERGPDSLFTAVLVDKNGDWPENPASWITWTNDAVCDDSYYQSYNNISYCSNDGSYLVVWNDWRATFWSGNWNVVPLPTSDIYGQRAYLNPEDSSLVWIDHDGSWTDVPLNTPIAFTDADEGDMEYPGIAFGPNADAYLVAYNYAKTDTSQNIDIYANLYQGAPPAGTDAVEDADVIRPDDFALRQNYPNPFNPDTRIDYVLKSNGRVTLRIFDILGREVVTLADETQRTGTHRVEWNGRLPSGVQAASGVYIARLTWTKAGQSVTLKKKMVLSR